MRALAVSYALLCVAASPLQEDSAALRSSATPGENVLLQLGRPLAQRAPPVALARESLSGPNVDDDEVLEQIYFDAVIRDFTSDHPDFQSSVASAKGLVKQQLGGDKKPVFNGGPKLSNKTNFDQWYRDVPGVNKKEHVRLDLQRSATNTFVYEHQFFFPIDGRGWNDSMIAHDNNPHNFFFTLEMHTDFFYRGSEVLTFRGDDDVWVFIDDELVIDLGGTHPPLEGSVAMDDLSLTPNSVHRMSFFFAERHCCGSTFRLETTITPKRDKSYPQRHDLSGLPLPSTCMIWGDPHVDVFDNRLQEDSARSVQPFLPFYSSGDYWLVKSDRVKIQGRYGPTQWTVGGQSALLALAVGGPFLLNHTLIIEPMDGGNVTWDGKQILQDFPSEFMLRDFVRVSFNSSHQHIDDAQKNFPVHMVEAWMPRLVHLTVNRWAKHIDAIIRMVQQPGGQDGHCGNFNGNPNDDTKELIDERAGALVLAEASLFPSGSERLADCPFANSAEARKLCEAAFAATDAKEQVEACVFDVCFGGKEFAEEDAVMVHEEEEEEKAVTAHEAEK